MLSKTRGIVLSFIKFRETSLIIKIYTEEFGLKSYIVNGVRSRSSKIKIALFQPLTILDLVVYENQNIPINRISEVKCHYPYKTIPFEIQKSAIILFLSEIFNKTLKEQNNNPDLFQYLTKALIYLDTTNDEFQNFHLHILCGYSSFLGFSPSNITDLLGEKGRWINELEKEYLESLIKTSYNYNLQANNEIRRSSLQHLINFYRLHIENFGEIKSEKILKEILK